MSELGNGVKEWVNELGPVVEQSPELLKVDLVIEGGIGTGAVMPNVAKELFPKAHYIATDLFAELVGTPRQRKVITPDILERVIAARPRTDPEDTQGVLFASCFDFDLIRNIQDQTGSQHPVLVSLSALFALMDKKMNPWERKDQSDRVYEDQILGPQNPYVGHIHAGAYWEDGGETSMSSRYFRLDKAAQQAGWRSIHTEAALMLIAPA